MKNYLLVLPFIFSKSVLADSCSEVAKYNELMSQIYVVCPELPNMGKREINKLVLKIFSSQEFVPDEYTIDFVLSAQYLSQENLTKTTHIGRYYTHSNQITIWPKNPDSKKVIQLSN